MKAHEKVDVKKCLTKNVQQCLHCRTKRTNSSLVRVPSILVLYQITKIGLCSAQFKKKQ